MLFLALDFGTSSVKVALVDEHLRELEATMEPYPYILLPGAKVEIDPYELFAALYRAVSRLDSGLRKKVDVLCYDAFSPSPVLLTESGDLSYPRIITHMDRRSHKQCAYIDELIGRDRYLHIAGIYPFPGGAGIMTLLWLAQHEPHYLATTFRVGHLTTYLHKHLTGEWAVDLVNASMLGTYETLTQAGWSTELLQVFQLNPEWFGPIYNPGTLLGQLLPHIARKLGVPSGIPVAVGTNDVAAAQVGAGNREAGCVMNAAGSSDMVSILTDTPVVNPHYYLRNAAFPGMWQIYATTAGGFALEWFHSQFARDLTSEEFYHTFIPSALDTYREDGDVLFDPYLTGDRQSMELRTAAWYGLTLNATREEMIAALLKSMNRVLATTLREASQVVKLSPVVKLTGGMSTEPFIRLKEREMPGLSFQVVHNCPVLGSVALAQCYL